MFNKFQAIMLALVVVLLSGISMLTLVLPDNVSGGFWYVERFNPANPTFVIIEDGQEKIVYRKDTPFAGQNNYLGLNRGEYWIRPFGIHRNGVEGFVGYLTSYITLLALSMLLLYLLPKRIRVMVEGLEGDARQRLTLFLIGLTGSFSIVVLTLLLWLNMVWTPLLVLFLPLTLLGCLIGLVAVASMLGRLLLGSVGGGASLQVSGTGSAVVGQAATLAVSPVQSIVVGLTLIYLGSIVPYLGWVLVGLATVYGLGALIGTRLGTGEPWSLDESDFRNYL